MIYFSIPVHEQIPVIINQLRNFATFAPEVCVVLHRSAQAAFSHGELNQRLAEAGLQNVAVNPHSVSTAWGSIIAAHLSNIQFIRQRGDANLIGFHSSNDMLVRSGVVEFIGSAKNCLHDCPFDSDSSWCHAKRALKDDALTTCLSHLGNEGLANGQIEGSVYQAEVLFDIADLAADDRFSIARQGPQYPREEVWFPSLARALGVRPAALPYVFSEVHRYGHKVQRLANVSALLPRWLGREFLRKRILDVCYLPRACYMIRASDVEALRERRPSLERWCVTSDGSPPRRLYDVETLFGVKRIARSCDDPVRRYISNLQPHTAASRASRQICTHSR